MYAILLLIVGRILDGLGLFEQSASLILQPVVLEDVSVVEWENNIFLLDANSKKDDSLRRLRIPRKKIKILVPNIGQVKALNCIGQNIDFTVALHGGAIFLYAANAHSDTILNYSQYLYSE